MFKNEPVRWNTLNAVYISNDRTGDKMVIVPELGATLLELVLAGKTLIKVDEQFPDNYLFQSAILSPFPNKIRSGVYHFSGKKYELEKNDSSRKNAAHGLVYNKPFDVEFMNCSSKYAEIGLGYTYDHDDNGYPFKYHLSVSYLLKSDSSLTIIFQVTNLSDRIIPYGMGLHPYFQLDVL
jgi:aldose 1-epimerase